MKLDKTQPLYILYGCNIVKERSTMRLVAATTDEEMLKVIIGSQILLGVMDYRGFSNMKGFQQFRAACRNGDDGWELYRHLKDHLGMEDQEISRAGFELDEFYEDEAPEDEADYEPEDDYEEDCDEEL